MPSGFLDSLEAAWLSANQRGFAERLADFETPTRGGPFAVLDAELLRQQGQHARALAALETCQEGALSHIWRLRQSIVLGRSLKQLGERKRALEVCLEASLRDPPPREASELWNLIGNIQMYRRDHLAALDAYERSLESIKALKGDTPWVLKRRARLQCNLGITYSELGDYDGGIRAFERALEAAKPLGDHYGIAGIFHNYAVVLNRLEHWQRALTLCEHTQEELAISAQPAGGLSAASANLRADIHQNLKDYPTAERWARQALAQRETLGSPPELAASWCTLAEILHGAGDRAAAMVALERTMQLLEGFDDPDVLLHVQSLRADFLSEAGAHEQAATALAAARAVLAQGATADAAAELEEIASRVHERAGRWPEALAAQRALLECDRKLRRDEALASVTHLNTLRALEESRRAQALLEHKLEELRHVESVARAVAGTAHDLRNILTTINLFLEVATVKGPTPRFNGKLEESLDRATALTDDLLSLATSGARQRLAVPTDLAEALRAFVPIARRIAGPSVTVSLELASTPEVSVASINLHRILLNLVLNACEAMGGEGQVTMESGVTSDGACFIAVRDVGPGVPEGLHDRLFEPMFTTKETGTGLGLGTTQALARGASGELRLDPAHGPGARFIVTLPPIP